MSKGNDKKKSSLDEFKDKLYSAEDKTSHVKELNFRKKAYDVKREWGEKLESGEMEEYVAGKKPFFQKLLIISAIFFGAALLISAALFLMGSNAISTDNVVISASGPVRVEAGEEASFEVSVVNKNNISLKNAVLSVRFPENTRKPDNLNEELLRLEEEVGVMAEGGRVNRRISAVFFGEEGSSKELVISLEYEVEGSTAVFQVEKLYTVTISSSPVSVEVEAQKEVSSGSEVDFEVTVSSNSNAPIKDLMLTAAYPFGFSFLESDPEPTFGDNGWLIGDLGPDEEVSFHIRGNLSGQDREERVFRFTAGIQDPKDEEVVRTPIFSLSHDVVIARPALAIRLFADDNQSQEVAIDGGQTTQVKVVWENNSASKIVDASVIVSLSGEILNKREVRVSDGGFYRSSDNTITWTPARISSLKNIEPGQGGAASFSVIAIPFSEFGEYPVDPNIRAEANIAGNVPSETGRESKTASATEVVMKVNTTLGLTSRLFREEGPFENSGPVPPVVEETTTYTVVWDLSNTANDIRDSRVVATLPPYVEWVGEVEPSSEDVKFIPSERLVVWELGDVSRGTGFENPLRRAFFQVAFTPSANQVGQAPEILSKTQAVGKDTYTGITVSADTPALTTNFTADPSFKVGDEKVQSRS